MPGYAKEFLPNGSQEQQKEFERRVREIAGNMSELSAAMLIAKEMREEKAEGGRAGYYGGGPAMVGEDLSTIGHGSDALMARNMQVAPGGQATTSTGLNYLLGQDNDTVRVPYKDAGPVILPKPKPKNFSRTLDMLNTQAAANSLDTKTYVNLVGEFAKKAFDNGELSEVEYMRIIQPLFGEVGEMVTNQIQDDQNYLEKYADGGRIGFGKGKLVIDGIMKLFKNTPVDNTIKEFLSKRQFMKDIVGNTKKAERARELKMLKEAAEEARNNPGFKFKDIDIDKDIRPIFDLSKNRTLNSDGGRIGFGKGKLVLDGIMSTIKFLNKKSPIKAGKDYFKNIKDKTLKANETGKFMDLPIAEVGIPATTGALVNNQVIKKLDAMNDEQKELDLKEFIEELENDEFYQKYPELKDKTIAGYTEKLFRANGGRIGYASKGDVSLLDFINVNASGTKSGKNKITGAPKGITVDSSAINAIIDLDIPINEKINILGSYAYGKGRNKIEKGDEELFLDEGGYKDRNIGLGFNQGGEGLSGSVIRNLESGDDNLQIDFKKTVDFNKLFNKMFK